MKVAIIGSGYVGLVTAACLAEKGNDVILVDVDQEKVKTISEGKPYFYEPGLNEIVESTVAKGHLKPTTNIEDIKDSQIIFIAVGTPQGDSNIVNTKYVLEAAKQIGEAIKDMPDFKVIVGKSTVPPGTNKEIKQIIKNYRKDDTFAVASNPEFLAEGSSVIDFKRPDRIVIGTDNTRAEELLKELYSAFVRIGTQGRLIVTTIETAELIKYACNSMLATRIAFMNELAFLAEEIGADINQIREAMGTDKRIGSKFLFAGPGYGGSCFPKDLRAIIEFSKLKGIDLSIISAVDISNTRQRYRAADVVKEYFKEKIRDKKIAIWGLAFKQNTDDIRESQAGYITQRLLDYGAKVMVYDPELNARKNFKIKFGDKIEYSDNIYDVLNGCSALLIVTDWDEFKGIDLEKVKSILKEPVIIDFRNLYNLEEMKKHGFDYISIGRPKVLTREQ